ncbi:MAG: hypothetical protein ACM31C_21305 [Acidobacteriota bacterium]
MRVLPVAALVGLSGCAQLFGIDETSGPKDTSATLQLSRKSVGATLTSNPLDVTSLSATFYTTDGTGALVATPGTQSAVDTWSADVTGDPAIEFTLPDLPNAYQHLWSLPSRAVRGHFIAYEHPAAQPAPSATTEMISLTLPTPYQAASETFDVGVIGAWSHHVLSGSELPLDQATQIAASVPYSSFVPVTASPVTRITSSDVVVVMRHSANTLTGVYTTSFDQSDTMDTISGMLAEVALDKTFSATIDPTTFASRFSTVRPGVSGLALGWSISAAPGYTVGAVVGPLLRAGSAAMADTMISSSYGNPFEMRGWRAVLAFSASAGRTYTASGASIGLGAQIETVVDPSAASALELPAPLAELISIDSTQLNMDGLAVTLDVTAPHAVTAITETSPAASLYMLDVVELVTVGTMMERKEILNAVSTTATFSLPPGVLQTGHTYVLNVGAMSGGYPNASSGDLDTVTLPYTFSSVDSGAFQVMP